MPIECRYPNKRLFLTKSAAELDIERIKKVRGDAYQQLYPYKCPAEHDHWHLSSSKQGVTLCPICREMRSCWQIDAPDDDNHGKWIIQHHSSSIHEHCPGSISIQPYATESE